MEEALTLFDAVGNSRWFTKTTIVRPSVHAQAHPTALI